MQERHRQEIDLIQEKVCAALGKKKETIEQLAEEVRIKDVHI